MKSVAGFTCKQMKATGASFCTMVDRGLLPSLCTCSCPPKSTVTHTTRALATGTRTGAQLRRVLGETVGYGGSAACKMKTFDDKLDALNLFCCNATDKDDKCHGGVPLHSGFEVLYAELSFRRCQSGQPIVFSNDTS